MTDTLHLTPVHELKALVDTLDLLDIDPLHLHVDGRTPGDERPSVRLWLRTRTEFEQVCDAMQLSPEERIARCAGQREWFAEGDTPTRRLLVQVVSFVHQSDWQPREGATP